MKLGILALESVEDVVEDNDLIKPPQTDDALDGGVKEDIEVLMAKSDDGRESIPTEQTMDRLAKANLQFTEVTESISRLANFRECQAGVVSMESISRLDAENIGAVLGGEFNARLPMNQYTNVSSKTNLSMTKSYVASALEAQIVTSGEKAKAFFTGTANELISLLNSQVIKRLPQTYTQVVLSLAENKALVDSGCENPDFVIPMNGSFVNVGSLDLTTFDPTLMPASTLRRSNVVAAANAIRQALSIPVLRTYLTTVLKTEPLTNIFDPIKVVESQSQSFTSKNLLCLLQTPQFDGLLDLIEQSEHVREKIVELQETAMKAIGMAADTSMDTLWEKQQEEIQIVLKQCTDLVTLSLHLENLIANLNDWFFYLRTM